MFYSEIYIPSCVVIKSFVLVNVFLRVTRVRQNEITSWWWFITIIFFPSNIGQTTVISR